MNRPSVIAIDGPGAVGKSTVGKIVAQKLGYHFIDTGEMYRALTWLALHYNIDLNNELALGKLAQEARIEFKPSGEGHTLVLIDGYDVTKPIRSPEVETGVSQVAKVTEVRKALVAQQQDMAKNGNVVMVGRDIGTIVLPQAELKIFLTASPEERAHRRYLEQSGNKDYQSILAELKRRDELDSKRSLSPLHPSPEAVIIDTEGFSPVQVATKIIALVR